MPSRLTHIEYLFGGGWAPDYGSSAHVKVDESGRCEIPWLDTLENYEFEYDGSIHKIGGCEKLFAVALESGSTIRGLYDFWKEGVIGSPSQYRVLHVSSKVKLDTGDASFSDIFTGLAPDSIPNYSVFEGYLIISQTGADMPMYTDGVTHTAFTSPTPNFSFSEPHKLRTWAAGVDAAPSTLFYSAQEDPTDWTGAGSGDIAISPGDGDRILAIASHRNELFVFKGPRKGSIHRISGSAPTGDDAFARNDFIPTGLGAVGQRSIFRFGNDLGFVWSDGSVHSLNTTERYGDFLETALSRPLNKWLRRKVNSHQLEWANAVTSDSHGVVRIAMPVSSSSLPNAVISMDFRFDPPRWSHLDIVGDYAVCIASVVDKTTVRSPRVMTGGADGFVRKWDNSARSIDGASMSCNVRSPFLSHMQAPKRSTIYFGGVRCVPKSDATSTYSWYRDGQAQQSYTFSAWQGDVLAPAPAGGTNFTLGTSVLGGETSISQSMDLHEGGEFQQIQYGVVNSGVSNDIHIQSFLSSIKPGGVVTEELA